MWTTKYKRSLATILIAITVLPVTLIYYPSIKPRMSPAIFRYTETITVKNNGTKPVTFGELTTESFLNLSWQKTRIINVSKNYEISLDKDGNPFLLIEGQPELASNETYSVRIIWEIESFPREFPQIRIKKSGNLSEIPLSLINYTKEISPWKSPPYMRLNTDNWNNTDYYNLTLRDVALNLKGESQNVLEILLNDVDWIKRHIQYSSAEPTYPIETARNRRGDCDDQSNLLIALLRIQGIPSFLMMGQVYLPNEAYKNITGTAMNGHLFYEANHTLGHAWAMVFVPPWGWLPCDPVMASYGNISYAITEAIVLQPVTLIFKNVTGIYELEGADYIGLSREETKRAEEEDIYFWLLIDMNQISMPEYIILFQYPVLILYLEIICFTILTIVVAIYDKKKATRPPAYLGTIHCIYCGAGNPFDAIYCGNCGRRLTQLKRWG